MLQIIKIAKVIINIVVMDRSCSDNPKNNPDKLINSHLMGECCFTFYVK